MGISAFFAEETGRGTTLRGGEAGADFPVGFAFRRKNPNKRRIRANSREKISPRGRFKGSAFPGARGSKTFTEAVSEGASCPLGRQNASLPILTLIASGIRYSAVCQTILRGPAARRRARLLRKRGRPASVPKFFFSADENETFWGRHWRKSWGWVESESRVNIGTVMARTLIPCGAVRHGRDGSHRPVKVFWESPGGFPE